MLQRILGSPFSIIATCVQKHINRMDEPLKRHIEEHNTTGEDLCANVWKEYWAHQRRLIPYRWKRFASELAYIRAGNVSVANTSLKHVILYARALIRCFFLFIVFAVVGRRSVFPPLEPDSPFVEELEKNWRPNHKKSFDVRTLS
ncbi:hypothetical protein TRVL_06575 [Trypanosoma vivax]|nr:hypothetical protein TRVL_06575 [Trypanosoma vivax]